MEQLLRIVLSSLTAGREELSISSNLPWATSKVSTYSSMLSYAEAADKHFAREDDMTDLNKLLAMGKPAWKEARATIQKLLSSSESTLRDNYSLRQKPLVPMDKVQMVLSITIGDYTDFFSSMHHAKNCGTIFRGPENPIPSNWFHLPIAYHGRASSIVISGTAIVRPRQQ